MCSSLQHSPAAAALRRHGRLHLRRQHIHGFASHVALSIFRMSGSQVPCAAGCPCRHPRHSQPERNAVRAHCRRSAATVCSDRMFGPASLGQVRQADQEVPPADLLRRRGRLRCGCGCACGVLMHAVPYWGTEEWTRNLGYPVLEAWHPWTALSSGLNPSQVKAGCGNVLPCTPTHCMTDT